MACFIDEEITAYFGNIRTPISVVSGQHNGNIRTL